MVSSVACITCFMILQYEQRILSKSRGATNYRCTFVILHGLRIHLLQKEPSPYGPHIEKYVKETLKLPKSNIPKIFTPAQHSPFPGRNIGLITVFLTKYIWKYLVTIYISVAIVMIIWPACSGKMKLSVGESWMFTRVPTLSRERLCLDLLWVILWDIFIVLQVMIG